MQDVVPQFVFASPAAITLDGQGTQDLPLIVFNSLAWERTELIRIIIKDDVQPDDAFLPLARIVSEEGVLVPCQVHAAHVNGAYSVIYIFN